jgi:hypothetical protein
LFAELKNQIGLHRLRLRRLKFVREQFFLAAAAQNLKRLVRFLSQTPKTCSGGCCLETERRTTRQRPFAAEKVFYRCTFSTPTPVIRAFRPAKAHEKPH